MNVSAEELLGINANNLRQKQYVAYKAHVLGILDEIRNTIRQDGDPNRLMKHVMYSPAGDGMGMDNHVINFGFGDSCHDEELRYIDFLEALIKLADLRDGCDHYLSDDGEIKAKPSFTDED